MLIFFFLNSASICSSSVLRFALKYKYDSKVENIYLSTRLHFFAITPKVILPITNSCSRQKLLTGYGEALSFTVVLR